MRRTSRSLRTGLMALALSLVAQAGGAARAELVRHGGSGLYWLDMPGHTRGEMAPSASGLVRTEQRIAGWVDTERLPPSTVATLWWAIFNEPAACKHPTAVSRCGTRDLATAGTVASLQYAGEGATDEEGFFRLLVTLPAGSTDGCPAGYPCSGLLDPMDADVLMVLRLHPALHPKTALEPPTTWSEGCSSGTPCVSAQFAVHQTVPNWVLDEQKGGARSPVVGITISNFRYCRSPACTPADQPYQRGPAGPAVYNPQGVVEVRPGDTVTWFYQDQECDINSTAPHCPGHNVVFEDGLGDWPQIRSPLLPARDSQGQTFSWTVPTDIPRGTVIPYYCDINDHFKAGMTGALRVSA